MDDTAFKPSRRHADLGPAFFDPVTPARFPQTILRYRNQAWAGRGGLGGLSAAAAASCSRSCMTAWTGASSTSAHLEDVVARIAPMGAQCAAAVFVHGLLHSDNINVTGESFDYGP